MSADLPMPSTPPETARRSLHALPPGTVLHDYVIDSELGSGGFSVVYLARHRLNSDWLFAIKEYLPRELAVRDAASAIVRPVNTEAGEGFEDGLRRFRDEAKHLRTFRNVPSVVSCLNYFEANGTAYLVMDYDDGLPLSEFLRQREAAGQPFTESDLRAVVEPLLEGLEVVHRAGVLHRDIKPGNIFVRRPDDITGRPAQPVLVDFGAAKQNYLSRHSRSQAPYTPGYAAYEQVSSEGDIGPWTDIYAIGALMWRMVAGGCPGDQRLLVTRRSDETGDAGVWNPTPRAVERRAYALHRGRGDPMLSAVELGAGRFPRASLAAIDRCLTLYPEDRPQSCDELREILDVQGQPVPVSDGYAMEPSDEAGGNEAQSDSRTAPTGERQESDVAAKPWNLADFLTGVPQDQRIDSNRSDVAKNSQGQESSSATKRLFRAFVVLGLFVVLVLVGESMGLAFVATLTAGAVYWFLAKIKFPGKLNGWIACLAAVVGVWFLAGILPDESDSSVETVSSVEQAVSLESITQSFTVETEPPEAHVRILNIRPIYQPGMLLPAGDYRVEVSVAGYESWEGVIRHGSEPTREMVTLSVLPLGVSFTDELSSGGEGPAMVVIPAGRFRMGCVSGRECTDSEFPVHEVAIPQPFAVSKYEVTFAEWDACVAGGACGGYRPGDEGWGRDGRPVINVSWDNAREYVTWLSGQTGAEYRLLSEAEWEYAARAGSQTAYSWGNEIGVNYANCGNFESLGLGTCGDRWEVVTAPVGSFEPNAFGVHDMHGNVFEWVEDCWNASYAGAPSDGSAWQSGDCTLRVLRGGSWSSDPGLMRSALRYRYTTGNRVKDVGFRVARMFNP